MTKRQRLALAIRQETIDDPVTTHHQRIQRQIDIHRGKFGTLGDLLTQAAFGTDLSLYDKYYDPTKDD